MSGHSHFKTILRRKTAEDEKRGKVFSKMARVISVAARDGADPETNAKLKQAIDQAKAANVPKENIERAIRRGSGQEPGVQLEEVSYEIIGPGGVSIILEGITDNKNRTLSEIRQILQKQGAKLANEGSLKWAFGQKGVLALPMSQDEQVSSQEELELKAIEAGAEDIHIREYDNEKFMEIITKPEDLEKTKQALEKQGLTIEASSLDWLANEYLEVVQKTKEKCLALFDELNDHEAIQDIYSNLKT